MNRPIRDRVAPRLAAADKEAQKIISELFSPGKILALISGIPDRMHGRRETRLKLREV